MKPPILATGAYQDLVPGDKHAFGSYRLDSAEIKEFAARWDPMPVHVDEAAAKASLFGGLTACGTHLLAIRVHLIQAHGVNPYVIASLGYEVKFLKPARSGDLLTLYVECASKRESKSRPGTGIVQLSCTLNNQADETVLSMMDTLMIKKSGK
ncbi:MAG: MaoC/PaaZ C-terminal domain-containing protein [Rhodospirillales bacterium]|jgi:acyl dehydratase|nr:dehydratase [Rhodospirillaceae bacterium]MDP6429056.1 MaoC/PaaZ C-terminal domain-containing protein [Rhodospirillales bacterium]MDP6644258.1 MaoC/PaaZ C-terminal domain-containing protein [Rhodospirillales bacterium]MDP6843812.1 MaoC/PaaZ C-terminal domain-containing protein [Rhodospirillales bacterium]|tara:strand:+ start:773 stop:1231 length:459 start_codon:yes stop_codon:yes gene_type:complete